MVTIRDSINNNYMLYDTVCKVVIIQCYCEKEFEAKLELYGELSGE